jgi:RNA polymerase sigma factor (TIGR02999 family)
VTKCGQAKAVHFLAVLAGLLEMAKFTELLEASKAGDAQAKEDLFALVYDDLRQLAEQYLARERPGQTLQATALVHEVYLRLFGDTATMHLEDGLPWKNHRHFMAAVAVAMRRILIDAARRKNQGRRGGSFIRMSVDLEDVAQPEVAEELLALDEALTALAEIKPKIAALVTLRYFGGLTLKQAATTLEIPLRTANAHWAYARVWLRAEMQENQGNMR